MSAVILDGLVLAKALRHQIATQAQALSRPPGLAVILVGDDPASALYVKNKVKACVECGFHSVLENYPGNFSEAALLERISALNNDPTIDGILVQLPVPQHINTEKIIAAIDHQKDVDGFHALNAGGIFRGHPLFTPCTPYGVMHLLAQTDVPLRGAHAVIVGASNIVGKPMAMLLLHAGATVTICNSKTKDLAAHTRLADIVVMAVGKPNYLNGTMIKAGAVLIDVGINRLPNGSLCGDIDWASCRDTAGYITPVPGGVGPMTIAMLLKNTLEAAQRHQG